MAFPLEPAEETQPCWPILDFWLPEKYDNMLFVVILKAAIGNKYIYQPLPGINSSVP